MFCISFSCCCCFLCWRKAVLCFLIFIIKLSFRHPGLVSSIMKFPQVLIILTRQNLSLRMKEMAMKVQCLSFAYKMALSKLSNIHAEFCSFLSFLSLCLYVEKKSDFACILTRQVHYLLLSVGIEQAHRRQFDTSGNEVEPNFGQTTKVLKGYLNSSYGIRFFLIHLH